MNKNLALSKLLQEIKSNSSKWMKSQDGRLSDFKWQTGYGAFSVNERSIPRVVDYIVGQKAHHKNKNVTFKEEYLGFLKAHDIEYDEQFLWD